MSLKVKVEPQAKPKPALPQSPCSPPPSSHLGVITLCLVWSLVPGDRTCQGPLQLWGWGWVGQGLSPSLVLVLKVDKGHKDDSLQDTFVVWPCALMLQEAVNDLFVTINSHAIRAYTCRFLCTLHGFLTRRSSCTSLKS